MRPGGPGRGDLAWVEAQLLPAELTLWASMPAADRRHAVDVAKRVDRGVDALPADAIPSGTRPVVAAALVHDVGKTVSHLSTFGRVMATLLRGWLGHERVAAWTEGRGVARRVGLYVEHPRLGGDLLELAGSDPLTVTWTREHHLPPDAWQVPEPVGQLLKAADDD